MNSNGLSMKTTGILKRFLEMKGTVAGLIESLLLEMVRFLHQ